MRVDAVVHEDEVLLLQLIVDFDAAFVDEIGELLDVDAPLSSSDRWMVQRWMIFFIWLKILRRVNGDSCPCICLLAIKTLEQFNRN